MQSSYFSCSVCRFFKEHGSNHWMEITLRNVDKTKQLQIFHIVHELSFFFLPLLTKFINNSHQRNTYFLVNEGYKVGMSWRHLIYNLEYIVL